MIKYYLRTTNERKLDKSLEQIKYEKLVDTEHKAVKSFIEQLEYISDSDAVLLEDDIELCNNFKERIEKAISEYPDRVINFFSQPRTFFKTKEFQTFYFNQCTYYPKGVSKKLAEIMRRIEEKHPNKYQYDVLESMALKELKMKHIQYRPVLVQHLDFKSLVGNTSKYRITPYYINYLEELNIPYEKACFFVNLSKLYKLLEEHIKIKRIEIFEPQNENEGVEKK